MAPARGGAADDTVTFQFGLGRTVGMPYDEYAMAGADRSLAWWDADETGPSNAVGIVGKGKFLYPDGGRRYGYMDLPEAEPEFFDAAGSAGEIPVGARFPDGVVPEAMPCTACPSSTAT